ncbi:MAG: YfhO family protein [Elusimicrobiota bacterium]
MDLKRRRDAALIALMVAAAVSALLLPALIRGEGLLPVGSLWRVPPWNAALPRTSGNGLLVDQLLELWPWRLFLRSELLLRRFPFWNPLIASGVPFAGCVQAAPFFPTNLLLIALSPESWSLAAAFLKLFAAGFFTALHARRLGAGRSGAALAGISFALCGFMVAWLGHPQTNAACLLPALFWTLGRAADRDVPRAWVPVAVVIGLILLGGHPPTALHVLAAGAAYAIFLRRDRLGAAGLAALAGAALAAPALLPYLEYVSLSSTAAAAAALARWSTRLSPWTLLHLLMPLASGSPTHGAEVLAAAFGLGSADNFIERAAWLGLPALAFAALALSRRGGERETRFHAGLALFGLAAALGVPPLPWLWRFLPGFSAANPTRLLLLFCFGAATLAGLGCDEDGEPAPVRTRYWVSGVFAAALLLDLAAISRAWSAFSAAELGFAFGQAAAFVAEAGAALWLLARPGARRWAPLVAALFLLRVGLGVNPTAPGDLLYPKTPGIQALAETQGEGRVFGLGWALAPDTGMAFGLRDARGRDFTTLRRYEELVTGRAGSFDFYQNPAALPPSPSLLAISALAATDKTAGAVPPDWTPVYLGDLLVFRAPLPGRRALFVPEARVAAPARTLAAVRAPGFDPSRTVWLDDWFSAPASSGAAGAARVSAETPDEVVVTVRSDGPGWLLLLDSWYPGWRATVNGAAAPVRRADYAFRAVAVPAGDSTVRFTYVPFSFWIGLALSALSVLGLALAWRRA